MSQDLEGVTTEAFSKLSMCHMFDSVTLACGSEDREIGGGKSPRSPCWIWDRRKAQILPRLTSGHSLESLYESENDLSLPHDSIMTSSFWGRMVMSQLPPSKLTRYEILAVARFFNTKSIQTPTVRADR